MRDLKKYEWFKRLPEDLLQRVSRLILEKGYGEGEVIFEEGSPGDSLCLVEEGEVAIRRWVDKASGKRKTIAVMEEGDFFGEMAVLDDKPRSASALASKRSKILVLRKDDFWGLIEEEPKTGIANFLLGMNRVMSERLRVANQNFITTFEIGQIMATAATLSHLFDLTLEQLSSAIEKSDASFGALYDEFSEEFIILSKGGKDVERINDRELTGEDSVIKELISSRKWIYIEDEGEREKYSDFFNKICDAKSLMVSPIVREERLLGILFVVSFKEYHAFSQANRLLVGTVASQIGPAIENLKYKEEEENRERLRKRRYSY